jgi:hypothetical protein
MLIITSISPNHKNSQNQIEAIKSWLPYGNVYSMNNADEIKRIDKKDYPGVSFLPTTRTIEQLFGIPRVSINAMIDVAKLHCKDLLLINSDILIERLPEFQNDGVTILSRYDYTNSLSDAIHFEFGFDLFYLPKEFLELYPPSMYGMGSTWTDFSIPYRMLVNGIKVYWPQCKCLYHKTHELQWNFDEWNRMGNYFRWEFNLESHLMVEQIATQILAEIKNRVIK